MALTCSGVLRKMNEAESIVANRPEVLDWAVSSYAMDVSVSGRDMVNIELTGIGCKGDTDYVYVAQELWGENMRRLQEVMKGLAAKQGVLRFRKVFACMASEAAVTWEEDNAN